MSLLPPPIPDLDTETGTPQPPQDPPDRLLSQQHRRQLFAWWSYGLAAESFAAVGEHLATCTFAYESKMDRSVVSSH